MKGILFFLVLLGIVAVVWSMATKEGFQDTEGDTQPPGALNIPLISPRYQTLTSGVVNDFAPPSATLLAPPPGQSASVNSQPAEDPALEKASSSRIQSIYESITGFFKKDAPGLQKIGDPSVQLPMSTSRSDFQRLKDELSVLSRNPGLESSLTSDDLDGIEANLAYLQKKWTMSTNSMNDSPMEGFQSGGASNTKASDVTMKDLEDLSTRIGIEIIRLQSSGTTNLNTKSRIETLTKIQKSVSDLIAEINKGARKLSEAPFMKADITKFLPTLTNPNTQIGTLFGSGSGTSMLESLFPKYSAGDIDGAKVAQALFKQYEKDFLNNLSWDVSLHYVGNAEQDVAYNYAKAAESLQAQASLDSNNSMASSDITVAGGGIGTTAGPANSSSYRGVMGSITQALTGMTPTHVSVGNGTQENKESHTSSPNASPLDWKTRSVQICAQIKARGYDANDFGCIENPDKMTQESFSWRGHTKMVCNRLATIYDPSVPFLCGCPPPTWPGWRQ